MSKVQTIRKYSDVAKVSDNEVHLVETETSEFVDSSISFTGTGNVLYVEDGAKLQGCRLRFGGNDAVIYIRSSPRKIRIIASVFHDSVLYIGPGSSYTSEARFMPTERAHVIIGSDAMVSSRVAFRTADPHLVYSVDSHQRINLSDSIWVGDHVWLGEESLMLKGSRIGSGSILAARTVVTKNVSSNVTGAGIPAREVSKGVFWTRPSVHAYTTTQTERSMVHMGSEFIYEVDATTISMSGWLADLNSKSSGVERREWCEKLDAVEDHNRFAV